MAHRRSGRRGRCRQGRHRGRWHRGRRRGVRQICRRAPPPPRDHRWRIASRRRPGGARRGRHAGRCARPPGRGSGLRRPAASARHRADARAPSAWPSWRSRSSSAEWAPTCFLPTATAVITPRREPSADPAADRRRPGLPPNRPRGARRAGGRKEVPSRRPRRSRVTGKRVEETAATGTVRFRNKDFLVEHDPAGQHRQHRRAAGASGRSSP